MAADHLDIFQYTFTLSASPPSRAGFGKPLIIVDLATNTLNGQQTFEVADPTEAGAALTAGYISQDTHDRVVAGFLQAAKPTAIKLGFVDLVGVEAWETAYARIRAVDADFYAVMINSRTAADIVAMATAIEAEADRQFFFQASDVDWLTTGVPAAYSTIDTFERTSMIFHDTDTEYDDVRWVADRSAFNPDQVSADWRLNLKGGAGLATGLTTAQKNFLIDTNHGNVALPLAANSYPKWVQPGQSMSGRSIYEMLSVDWYRTRTQEDFAQLLVDLSLQGRKLVVGLTGQTQVAAVLDRRLQQGSNLQSPHFIKGQTRVTPQAITQADFDAKQMRFKVEAQIAQSARSLVFNVFFQNSPLEET